MAYFDILLNPSIDGSSFTLFTFLVLTFIYLKKLFLKNHFPSLITHFFPILVITFHSIVANFKTSRSFLCMFSVEINL